jgi:hypothetical protein
MSKSKLEFKKKALEKLNIVRNEANLEKYKKRQRS